MKTKLAILFGALAVLASGCSGINATKSISPLDFLLPGLMQNTPAQPEPATPADDSLLAGSPEELRLPPARF